MEIPANSYFQHALEFRPEEEQIRHEMEAWLPTSIVDAHAHANLPQHVIALDDGVRNHVMSTFPWFTIEQSRQLKLLFYSGKQVRMLRFANAYRGIDFQAANRYLVENTPLGDRVALYGLPDNVEYTCHELRSKRYGGLKMYYFYFNSPAATIYSVFPPAILEEAQVHQIPIILHPPKPLLKCMDEIVRLLDEFPKLPVVLAHHGLYKQPIDGLFDAFCKLSMYPNLFVDTAMVPSSVVITYALKSLGSERILYGSDEPISLIRSTPFTHPERGARVATTYPYHWVDKVEQSQYGHLAATAVHAHWQTLLAIRQAVETLPKSEQELAKERIFCRNARIFGF